MKMPVKKRMKEVLAKNGIKRIAIFNEDPPYLNPYDYDLNSEGVPLVPPEDTIKNGYVFDNSDKITSEDTDIFVINKNMGGPQLSEGDMFAFNRRTAEQPLVFQAINITKHIDTNATKYIIETQDIGYLNQTEWVTLLRIAGLLRYKMTQLKIKVHNVMHDEDDFTASDVEQYIMKMTTEDRIANVRIAKGNQNSPIYITLKPDVIVTLSTINSIAYSVVNTFENRVSGVSTDQAIRDRNIKVMTE